MDETKGYVSVEYYQMRVNEATAEIRAERDTFRAALEKLTLRSQIYRDEVVCDDDINKQLYVAATNLDEVLKEIYGILK
jgi:hypothetical protein